MQIPVTITDNRGYRSMVDWLQVLAVVENEERDEVRMRFNRGLDSDYLILFQMSLDEFKKQVEEQLKPQNPSAFWETPNVIGTPV